MKLAIVVGHNARAQGAVRVTDGQTEFQWNGDLAKRVAALADDDAVKVFYRTPEGGYAAEIDRVYRATDAWGATCTIELHFNGSVKPTASGCLTLTSGSAGSLALAAAVHGRVQAVMGNRDRGIEQRPKEGRGGRSLFAGRAPAIMAEPYFGSNPEMCARADARKDDLAAALLAGARAFSGPVAVPA